MMKKWIVAAARMSAPFYAGAQSGAIDATTATGERAAQGGGVLGFGRTIYQGDKDDNRGSLNQKTG